MPARITKLLPPVWLLIVMTVMWLLNGVFPIMQVFPSRFEWVGRAGVLLGFTLVFYAMKMFKKARTPLKPFLPVKALLSEGLFRYSRNPVYGGMIVLLAGWAISLGSLSPWLGVAYFIWMIRRFWILPEEAQMEREMGQAYLDYKQRVRRWL